MVPASGLDELTSKVFTEGSEREWGEDGVFLFGCVEYEEAVEGSTW